MKSKGIPGVRPNLSSKDPALPLRHILQAIDRIEQHVAGRNEVVVNHEKHPPEFERKCFHMLWPDGILDILANPSTSLPRVKIEMLEVAD